MSNSVNTKKNNIDQHAVVIGAGFSGIATALRLRALGYRVTLMERLASLGGRAQVFKRGGYKHDAGPTVITAPFLFDELFELCLLYTSPSPRDGLLSRMPSSA